MFDLDLYRARTALAGPLDADLDTLERVQRAHRLAIAFENLDVVLRRPIAIDGASTFRKLVVDRRGGYCFEQNRLFLDVLTAIGLEARPLLARVWLGAAAVPPLTHTLSLVTIAGAHYIADPGFGGSYTPVMPLADDAEAGAPDGARFRLRRDAAHGWMLSRLGRHETTDGRGTGEGWQQQYSFTLAEVFDSDLAIGNHWSATAAQSRFVELPRVSIALPRGFATLAGRQYRRSVNDEAVEATIDDPRVYRLRLRMMFGIDVSAEEVASLGLFG